MTPSTYQLSLYKAIRWAKTRKAENIKKYNIVVSAVAGSGKSTSLRECVKIINQMFPDDQVLVLQFNKHIQQEMEAKMGPMANVLIKTSHSAGLMVLKRNKLVSNNMKAGKYYGIAKEFIKQNKEQVIEAYKPPNAKNLTPEQEKHCIDKAVSQLTELSKFVMATMTNHKSGSDILDMIEKHTMDITAPHLLVPWATEVVEFGLQAVKDKTMHSFDDMVCAPVLLGCKFPQYDWVFVDEAQDLTKCQLQLVMNFAERGICCAVGDRRQAIMGWTGAMSDGMDIYTQMTNARELPLNVCYRCDSAILDLARILVPEVMDREGAGPGLVEVIEPDLIPMKAQAGDYVLCRLTAPLVAMCIGFIKIGKAARVKGKDIGKKLVDLYEMVADLSGCKTTDEFIAYFQIFKEEEQMRCVTKKLSPQKVAAMSDEHECIEVIADYVSDKGTATTSHTAIKQQIENLFDDKITPDFVTLCTVHRSKGLEAKRIFIIEFHQMPFAFAQRKLTPEQYTQELNLMYVAITRAEKELYISGNGLASVTAIKSKLTNLVSSPIVADVREEKPTISVN